MTRAQARARLVALDRFDANECLRNFIPLAWPVLEPTQEYVGSWSVDAICEHLEAVTYGWINRLLINVPPGSMKALDNDTPILTLDGWVRHGDLQVGDFVYAPDGLPVRVQGCTEHKVEDCYEVCFDNGDSVVAGGAHLWAVERRNYGKRVEGWRFYREPIVTSTLGLLHESDATGSTKRPDRIGVAREFWAPRKRYLIDPYVLGAWLGDGSSNSGHIYSAEQDFAHFAALGLRSRVYPADGTRKQDFHRLLIENLQTRLRVLGLLHNKHVPEDYLLGAYADRLALLQGLMDTDGTVANGACSFTNKNKLLADAVQFLATSIGAKAHVSSRYTELNGVTYGPHYQVLFSPPVGVRVFRLDRKQSKVRQTTKDRTFSRYVVAVKPVGPRHVKCIQVEGGLYLAGKALIPTHNSLNSSVFWPAWEWGPRDKRSMRYIATAFNDGPVKRDTRKMRDLVASEWYHERWPRVNLVRSGETSFSNSYTGSREGVPFGSLTSQRADRLIIDDPHSTKTAESKTERENTVRLFREGAVNRLNDQAKSAIIVIMQRLNEGDVAGEILLNDMGYCHLNLPMYYEKKPFVMSGKTLYDPAKPNAIGFVDPRREEGELLNPDRFPLQVVKDLERDMMGYAFAGQYQQRPVPREGGMFKLAWFDGKIIDEVPLGCVWCRHWDLAATKNKTSAYTAGVRIGKTPDGRYVVAHAERFQEEGNEVRTRIKARAKLDGYGTLISLPQDPGQAGKVQKADMVAGLAGFRVVVQPETGDKEVRAEPFAVQCEAGNVYLVRGEWNSALLDELTLFPGSKFKDQVDACSGAFGQLVNAAPQMLTGSYGR